MGKIICADTSCKYNNNKNRCTAKEVNLGWNSIMTKWEGRREFLNCKTYEMSETYRELQVSFENMISRQNDMHIK